jgi:hypothetical protein
MDSIISVQIKQKTITWDWVDYEMHRWPRLQAVKGQER